MQFYLHVTYLWMSYSHLSQYNDSSSNPSFFSVPTTYSPYKCQPKTFRNSQEHFCICVTYSSFSPFSKMTPLCLPPNPFILAFTPPRLSSTHNPSASIFLYFLHLSSLLLSSFFASKDDTSHAEKNGGAPPFRVRVSRLIRLPAFSPESHFWVLLNTQSQSRIAEGATLCLKTSNIAWGTLQEYFTIFLLQQKLLVCVVVASLPYFEQNNNSNFVSSLIFSFLCSLSAMQTSLFQWRLMGQFIRYTLRVMDFLKSWIKCHRWFPLNSLPPIYFFKYFSTLPKWGSSYTPSWVQCLLFIHCFFSL